jgi:hypothetical protein
LLEIERASAEGRFVSPSTDQAVSYQVEVCFIVRIDSAGNETVVQEVGIPPLLIERARSDPAGEDEIAELGSLAGLGVSPDETKFALANYEQVWIYTHAEGRPSDVTIPDGYRASQPRFSPDGKWLAAVGFRIDKSGAAILMSPGPEFESFTKVIVTRGTPPFWIAWSPDSQWLMAMCNRPATATGYFSLAVFELESGERFDLPEEIRDTGAGNQPLILIGGNLDWRE